MGARILVTSLLVNPQDHQLLTPLYDLGAELLFHPLHQQRAPGEMAHLLHDVDAVIASSDHISAADLEQAHRLRVIARTGVGYDAIDVDAARQRGIIVTITPGANDQAVADYTLAMMLALSRRLIENHLSVQSGQWSRAVGTDLHSKTIGIIGLGRIGKQVVKRLYGFEPRMLGHDLVLDTDFMKRYNVMAVSLDQLFEEADLITLHIALSAETVHLVNRERLQKTKRGVFLVNTCRGAVVDEAALIDALRSGQVGGAALDVFEQEPLSNNPLREFPNVILSPHVAGISQESSHLMAQMAIEEVVRVLRNEPTRYAVNSLGL